MPTSPILSLQTSYTHTTFADAITALSLRLYDPDFIYWTREEMGLHIIKALRMWQSVTGHYREKDGFTTEPGDRFYDVAEIFPTRFGYNILDQQVVKQIQYGLLEPATGDTWTGTDQFNLEAVTRALQRRRNQFLSDTVCDVVHTIIDPPSQPIGRVKLADSVLDVRRAAWIDLNGIYWPLVRTDEFGELGFEPSWPFAPGVPHSYSVTATPPVTMQLFPPPLDKGVLELITVDAGPDLDPTVGVLLSVPDDFAWAVEFGALADLLSTDGLDRDPSRVKYCEAMYKLGVEAAKVNPTVLSIQVNDQPVFITAVVDIDRFSDWENTPGDPEYAAMAGGNIFALGNYPDGEYGVTVDVCPNSRVPVVEGDWLQIGREHLEPVLDLAQHLAAFKQGGKEFVDTGPLHKNFITAASLVNRKLLANAFYREMLFGNSLLQDQRVPAIEDAAESKNVESTPA